MIHVFMLVVVFGTGDARKEQPNPMHFYSVNRCLYFAENIVKQYGNYRYNHYIDAKDRVTAYCKPVYVDPKSIKPEIYK